MVMCYNISMSNLPEAGIVVLSAIIQATLQLGTSALLLLYHASLGKHIKKRTRSLVSSYVLGTGVFTLLVLCTTAFMIAGLFSGALSTEWLTITVGVLLALAIIVWFFYYRSGKTTELWIPKVIARYIDRRAKKTESNTEAFSLGLLTCFAEMPFTIVLVVVAANSVLRFEPIWQVVAVVVYTLIAVLPLLVMRLAIRRGQTVVDVQKWRVKNKTFLKLISGFGFLVLGLFIIAFKVMGVTP